MEVGVDGNVMEADCGPLGVSGMVIGGGTDSAMKRADLLEMCDRLGEVTARTALSRWRSEETLRWTLLVIGGSATARHRHDCDRQKDQGRFAVRFSPQAHRRVAHEKVPFLIRSTPPELFLTYQQSVQVHQGPLRLSGAGGAIGYSRRGMLILGGCRAKKIETVIANS